MTMDTAAELEASKRQQSASGGAPKKAFGWNAVLHHTSHRELPGVAVTTTRPATAQAGVASNTSHARRTSKDALLALAQPLDKNEADKREVPNEAIFNTQFTTAGRKFLTKVKKNRAMQVDRRTKGFQQGIEQQSILIDPITKRHYRVLLVDPDMQRREDLADGLEQFFEVLVAPGNERALALLAMFKVDFVLLRACFGNDNAASSSSALTFLREIKKKFVHTPVSVMVPRMTASSSTSSSPSASGSGDMEKLLQRLLNQGACGFFEDNLPMSVFVERLGKLLHSLVVAQTELAQCHGITSNAQTELGDEVVPIQAIKKCGTTVSLIRRPATSKPDSVTYDQHRMMLELSLNQRKQCLLQRQALTEALDSQHSVLGVELSLSASSSTGLVGLASPAPSSSLRHSASSPGGGAFAFPTAERRSALAKKIPPLPSQKEISSRIYAKPQEIQQKIHSHLYETFHATKHDAMPQDPLLHHCLVIDPQTISKSSDKSLLVTKAFLLFQEQRYEEALLQANRAIKMQGNNLVKLAYVLRGALFDIGGQHARAEREFLIALELDPKLHQAHFNLSVSLLKMGKDTEALREISLALQSDPLNEQYLRNRALIYRRMGNFTMAQSEYAKLEALPRSAVAAALAKANALSPPTVGSFAKAKSSAALLLVQSSSSQDGQSGSSNTSNGDMEDGLFDHLFGKPTEDKVALVCPPKDRTPEMVNNIVALLQTVLVFQDFPAQVLRRVAELMEYEVVGCGKRFALGEDHPESFYVLLHGKLSVRRKFGDFASSVTTHHLEKGMTFGCTGHTVSLSTQLIADESSEVGILWPDAYNLSIRSFCTEKNSEIFKFLQQMKAFRHFSTSELGHIIGISERKRFRKGETILAQNEVPKHLCILWKGSCLMYQDFKKPPLCGDGSVDSVSSSSDDENGRQQRGPRGARGYKSHDKNQEKRVLPFHRYIAKPDWPLGFETSNSKKLKSRKQARGRRNALLNGDQVANSSQLLTNMINGPPRLPEKLKPDNKHALISTLVAPAIFGESAFLDQDHQRSKWYVPCMPSG